MRNFLILLFVFILNILQTQAFALKVYDEYGNRVGTYRKEGERYQFYDFYDKKIDNPEELIKNAPNQKTLTEYSRTFYDENMFPIGTWHSGFYGSDGRYYPRYGELIPRGFCKMRSPYIVRPKADTDSDFFKYADYKNNVNYVDTRFKQNT